MIKKQYLKSRPVCKVTFQLPSSVAAESVKIVGDFTDWQALEMEHLKDGRFKAVVELEQGREYQFRYLVDEREWHNEEEADRYVSNPFNSENAVLAV